MEVVKIIFRLGISVIEGIVASYSMSYIHPEPFPLRERIRKYSHGSPSLHIPVPEKCCTGHYCHCDLKTCNLNPSSTSSIHHECGHEAGGHRRSHDNTVPLVGRNQIVCPQSKRSQTVRSVLLTINFEPGINTSHLPNTLDSTVGNSAQGRAWEVGCGGGIEDGV